MKYILPALVAVLIVPALAGCQTAIRPLEPLKRAELWLPDDGSPAIQLSQPTIIEPEPAAPSPATTSRPAEVHPPESNAATQTATTQNSEPTTQNSSPTPATQSAATAPSTQNSELRTQDSPSLPPGHKIIKIIDPNQTARFVYNASYDNAWQQSILLLHNLGFALDRQDYRLGVLTTQPLPSAQLIEFWKPQHTDAMAAAENTVNSQRRRLRLTISSVPNKPKFYEIAIQILVEREANPTEQITGPLFIEGSGFGRNAIALRSDYAEPSSTMNPKVAAQRNKDYWIILGHDPKLEKKILDTLFDRI